MLYLIVNPVSGNGHSLKILKKLQKYLDRNGIEYGLAYTTNAVGPYHWAQKLTQGNYDDGETRDIVLVGGDGTYSEFLNGIVDFTSVRIGFIPAGRGNDFARALHLSKNPVQELQKILQSEGRYCDFIDLKEKRCLNIAGTGLDVEVLLGVQRMKRTNKVSYLKSMISVLHNFTPYDITVEQEGETYSRQCLMAGVCNGIAIGGGMKLSPRSNPFDGKLNVVIIKMPEDGRVFPILPKFLKGNHIDMSITEKFECERVTIRGTGEYAVQLDGQVFHNLPLDCTIVTDTLKILN